MSANERIVEYERLLKIFIQAFWDELFWRPNYVLGFCAHIDCKNNISDLTELYELRPTKMCSDAFYWFHPKSAWGKLRRVFLLKKALRKAKGKIPLWGKLIVLFIILGLFIISTYCIGNYIKLR